MAEAAIRVEALTKTYHAARGRTVEAVRGVSFDVGAGEIFGLLGPNGAGKTTLLRMIGTIIAPTSGACWVNGYSVADESNAVRRNVGFLSGNTRLYGRLTVREVLQYFGRLYGLDKKKVAARSKELFDLLGMNDFSDRRCETLSTGQTQRASIARVLLHDPAVLILDEPTLGLDIMTSQTILEFIRSAKDRGHSILFSTHYMTEAQVLCDRIGLIHEGRMLTVNTVPELLEETGTDNVQDAFLALVGEGAHREDAETHRGT